ncbi:hypothetical protein QBC39DRAFT_39733 [Podospora conica]|nr:hypothetical protein QBC39DRAFT_39733 [Schizothecium conicum]
MHFGLRISQPLAHRLIRPGGILFGLWHHFGLASHLKSILPDSTTQDCRHIGPNILPSGRQQNQQHSQLHCPYPGLLLHTHFGLLPFPFFLHITYPVRRQTDHCFLCHFHTRIHLCGWRCTEEETIPSSWAAFLVGLYQAWRRYTGVKRYEVNHVDGNGTDGCEKCRLRVGRNSLGSFLRVTAGAMDGQENWTAHIVDPVTASPFGGCFSCIPLAS